MTTEEISFLNRSDSYCICYIDMIESTKVISKIATLPDKVRRYYSIFLNSMSAIIKKYDGIITKNIGDSLIYYFPKTSDPDNRSAFRNVIECCITMMAAFKFVNSEMLKMKLPAVSYRISADYGKTIMGKSSNLHTYDLFGPVLDLCTKINSKAPPNGMVIGNDLYQVLKSFLSSSLSNSSFDDDYDFKMAGEYSITGLKQAYPIYSLVNKYTNYNNNNNNTATQDAGNENAMQLQEEKERGQIKQQENKPKNILLIDDESDIIFTYKSMLKEEGYDVDAFTDPRQALRHFSRLDPLYYKLILLDVRMPDVNGFQIYYKFKALNPNVKIIFVTALDVMGDEIASMLPNFSAEHDLIKKPVTKDQYIYKIRSVLSG